MKLPRCLLIAALVSVSVNTSNAQVGSPLPTPDFDGFTQTPAKSYDEYVGRVVLIEYFAHW
jgi:hypothetical protein